MHAQLLSCVQFFVTPWTIAHPPDCPFVCSLDFPGKNTRVGSHSLLRRIFLTQGSNPRLLHLLCWQADSLSLCHLGSPLAAVGALLFCRFIIYDTHSLMHRLSPEEYVLAAINLYLDIINLFLHLLRVLEAANKK